MNAGFTPERNLKRLRRKQKMGRLHPVHKAILDAHDANWSEDQRDQAWRSKLADTVEWIAVHGEQPRRMSSDPVEAALARWMSKQRFNRSLSDARIATLNEQILEWRVTKKTDTHWNSMLDAAVEWIDEHGRRPYQKSSDETESRHGQWFDAQRANKSLSATRTESLNERSPLWKQTRVSDAVWLAGVETVVTWIELNGRQPRLSSPDPIERRHAGWFTRQRVLIVMTDERRAALDRLLPGWDVTRLTIARGTAK